MKDIPQDARVKINFRTGDVEFSGSEEFVQQQLESSLEVIAEYMVRMTPKRQPSGKPGQNVTAAKRIEPQTP